jgi:hypothetical protein
VVTGLPGLLIRPLGVVPGGEARKEQQSMDNTGKAQLEGLVWKHGIANVLRELAEVALRKAEQCQGSHPEMSKNLKEQSESLWNLANK